MPPSYVSYPGSACVIAASDLDRPGRPCLGHEARVPAATADELCWMGQAGIRGLGTGFGGSDLVGEAVGGGAQGLLGVDADRRGPGRTRSSRSSPIRLVVGWAAWLAPVGLEAGPVGGEDLGVLVLGPCRPGARAGRARGMPLED